MSSPSLIMRNEKCQDNDSRYDGIDDDNVVCILTPLDSLMMSMAMSIGFCCAFFYITLYSF